MTTFQKDLLNIKAEDEINTVVSFSNNSQLATREAIESSEKHTSNGSSSSTPSC